MDLRSKCHLNLSIIFFDQSINFHLYCAKFQSKCLVQSQENQKPPEQQGGQEKLPCGKKPSADPDSRGRASALTKMPIEIKHLDVSLICIYVIIIRYFKIEATMTKHVFLLASRCHSHTCPAVVLLVARFCTTHYIANKTDILAGFHDYSNTFGEFVKCQ